MADQKTQPEQPSSKFIVFQSLRGLMTLPNGAEYEIMQLRPHNTDPKNPASPIWYEGFVISKSTDLRARDKIMETAFSKDGTVPAHLPGESNARPLQLKLNPYPEDKKRPDGKSPDYIGSVLTSESFFTVFARKMDGKGGLLLAGSVAPSQPRADVQADMAVDEPGQPIIKRGGKGAKPPRDPS